MTRLFDMQGRRVLISGGGTGLGKAFANAVCEVGAEVIVCGRREAPLQHTVAALQEQGACASYQTMDVTSASSIQAALDAATADGRLDVLVNNAGVVGEEMLINHSESGWDHVMNANLKGAFMLAQAAAQKMAADGHGGSIVNIASILGATAQKGTGPYGASKAALIHLTKNMAVEWARYGIRVNAIAPGYFRTDMADAFLDSAAGEALLKRSPIRRAGAAHELSGAILLLASDAGAFMTGSVVTVDGGQSIPTI